MKSIYNFFVLMPFFTCLLHTVILLFEVRKGGYTKKVLCLFMTVCALLFGSFAVYIFNDYHLYGILDSFYTFSLLGIFPLYFLYICSISTDITFRWKRLWVLFPATFFGLLSGFLYLKMSSLEFDSFVKYAFYNKPLNTTLSDTAKFQFFNLKATRVVFCIQLFPVLWYGRKHVNQYNKRIREYFSNTENKELTKNRILFISILIAAVLAFLNSLIGRHQIMEHSCLLLLYSISFSVLLFIIGRLGSKRHYTIRDFMVEIKSYVNTVNVLLEKNNPAAVKADLKEQLCNLMEKEKMYKLTELHIINLASELHTNRTYISNLINNEMNCSFSEFINRYRVEHSKKLLCQKECFILEHIANESGFNSVNSFLRAFKKETGLTPGEYRRRAQDA